MGLREEGVLQHLQMFYHHASGLLYDFTTNVANKLDYILRYIKAF